MVLLFDVVRLPRPMEGKWGDSNFQFFREISVPLHATGVVGPLNCCDFLYYSGILSTLILCLNFKDTILFSQCLLFECVYIYIVFTTTLCMYVVCSTSLKDSIDDRTVWIPFSSNDRTAPQTLIPLISY